MLDEMYTKYARRLQLPVEDVKQLLQSIISSENREEELINLIGYDDMDDVAYFLQYNEILPKKTLDDEKEAKMHDEQSLMHNVKSPMEQGKQNKNKMYRKKNYSNNKKDYKNSIKIQSDTQILQDFQTKSNESSKKDKNNKDKFIKEHYAENNNEDQKHEKIIVEEKFKTVVNQNYVEIFIPSKKTKIKKELISVSCLNEEHKKYFEYKFFNPVQSEVFKTAYLTHKNFLVSAPTGCGKTDIAFLAILKALDSEGKIVIIVPMKALATEITAKIRSRLKNIKIIEYTGDTETKNAELLEAKIVISTPEKFDVSTRRMHNSFVISLLILDEIHILHDERGSVIETIVCRTFRYVELYQKPIRIIGLSATLPNYKDISKFIKAEVTYNFDKNYRPVPLDINLLGIRKSDEEVIEQFNDEDKIIEEIKMLQISKDSININELTYKNSETNFCIDENFSNKKKLKGKKLPKKKGIRDKMNELLVEKLTPILEKNRQVLIFVTSRKETINTKNYLENEFLNIKFDIHHAGLPREIRLRNENRFKSNIIQVLITTSTLAWGVNLPARYVFIKGTQFYNQDKGRFEDIGVLDLLQIFGRAGRPQYDTNGNAYLITENHKLSHYLNLIRNNTHIESKLLLHVVDILNSEIYLGTITCLNEAIIWLKSTFLFIRMLKAPIIYGFSAREIKENEIDKVLCEYLTLAIKRLKECDLIELQVNHYSETDSNIMDNNNGNYTQIENHNINKSHNLKDKTNLNNKLEIFQVEENKYNINNVADRTNTKEKSNDFNINEVKNNVKNINMESNTSNNYKNLNNDLLNKSDDKIHSINKNFSNDNSKNFSNNSNRYELSVNYLSEYYDFNFKYSSTNIGRIASFFYLSHETMDLWQRNINYVYNEETILDLLFKSVEFSQIILREDEINKLEFIDTNYNIEKIDTAVKKMKILYFLYKNDIPTYNFGLTCDQLFIIKNLERIIAGFKEFALNYELYVIYEMADEIEGFVKQKKIIKNSGYIINLGRFDFIEAEFTPAKFYDSYSSIAFVTNSKYSFVENQNIKTMWNGILMHQKLNYLEILFTFGVHYCEETYWSVFSHKSD
ncbi:hypothetical protein COBT_001163, partial [Conglomerata obtusa]